MFTTKSLQAAAEEYHQLTGFQPHYWAGCKGTLKQKADALAEDIEWYRRHTQEIHQAVVRMFRAATSD